MIYFKRLLIDSANVFSNMKIPYFAIYLIFTLLGLYCFLPVGFRALSLIQILKGKSKYGQKLIKQTGLST